MELKLKRIACKDTHTIGRLYIDGQYFCDTLEPPVNAKTHPAIPTGNYRVTLGIKSPKYSNYKRYPWALQYEGRLPRLIGVKSREGILIHVGNKVEDTQGCILVGRNRIVGMVTDSTETLKALMPQLKTDKDNITIEIQ